jgi:hypothetical protein
MIQEPKVRQFLVEIDVEAKSYSDWLRENVNTQSATPQGNILDIFENRQQDPKWENKLKSIRNKLLRNNPSSDQFMLGITFMTCVFRHQHEDASADLKEHQRLLYLETCTENLEKIRSIYSTINSYRLQKELLSEIREAIQVGSSLNAQTVHPDTKIPELTLRKRLAIVVKFFEEEEENHRK